MWINSDREMLLAEISSKKNKYVKMNEWNADSWLVHNHLTDGRFIKLIIGRNVFLNISACWNYDFYPPMCAESCICRETCGELLLLEMIYLIADNKLFIVTKIINGLLVNPLSSLLDFVATESTHLQHSNLSHGYFLYKRVFFTFHKLFNSYHLSCVPVSTFKHHPVGTFSYFHHFVVFLHSPHWLLFCV